MTFTGLSAAQILGLLAVSGALTTLLYLVRQRRQHIVVPSSILWQRLLDQDKGTARLGRLRRPISLAVQLLVLSLIVGAAGDPRAGQHGEHGKHVILLIDTSASMAATDGDGGTRLDEARRRAETIIEGLKQDDRAMVVSMGAVPRPLSSFTTDGRTLGTAIHRLSTSHSRADLEQALRLCADLLKDRQGATLLLLGDGAYPQRLLDRVILGPHQRIEGPGSVDLRGVDLRYVPIGYSHDNVGIIGFSVRRNTQHTHDIFLEVASFRSRTAVVDLRTYADNRLVDVTRLRLRAGERRTLTCSRAQRDSANRTWCDLGGPGQKLRAQLVSPNGHTHAPDQQGTFDAFSLDDVAFAVVPARRKLRVLLLSRGNLFLEGALLLNDGVIVRRVAPDDYSQRDLAGTDVVITDGFYPHHPLRKDAIVLNPPTWGPLRITGHLTNPNITEHNTTHPTMRSIRLKDVNIRRSSTFELGKDDVSLASVSGKSLMVATERNGRRMLVIGFDPKESDLPLRIAFPLLLANTLDWFGTDADVDFVPSYRSGYDWSVPLGRLARWPTVQVRDPQGRIHQTAVNGGHARVHTETPGFYRITTRLDHMQIAANLSDPMESDIRPRSRLKMGGHWVFRPDSPSAPLPQPPWAYLALAAVLVLFFEWRTYNLRLTE